MATKTEKKTDTKTEKKIKIAVQKVKDYLKSLGAGPNKVAENLKKQKIKGEQDNSQECALAVALKKKFKMLEEVSVDGSCAVDITVCGHEAEVYLPSACCRFIDKFDEGKYPELVIE